MKRRETNGSESPNRLGRMLRASPAELACRGRQQAFKWMERIHSSISGHLSFRSSSVKLEPFFLVAKQRFFPGPFDPEVPASLTIRMPRACRELLATADAICRGRFDLLGYRDLDFGEPPDWHLDPISGRRAPLLHWTRIDPLDYTTVGDSKVIWELNRHQSLVHLGQAYRLTREERYAETLVRYLRSWLSANPPGIGINWTSSLEIALRLIAWCWAVPLIRDSRALTPHQFDALVESVQAHAIHIERYLSHYFSPNTHLTGEALGLFYAGVVFPQLRGSGRWRRLAHRILLAELRRQVLPDGVYFERSTCYQRYTLDTYLHFFILCSRVGQELPAEVREGIEGMLDFLLAVRQPDGSIPSIGDADGGWLLPLRRSQPEDFRAVFSTAAVLFKSSVYAWAAGELAPDSVWLLGASALDTFGSLRAAPPATDPCRQFSEGGYAVMRSGWEARDHSLIFDAGPLGCPVSSGHGHADLLSIQCSVLGHPFLIDAGTYCYTADPELRNYFRGTAAHSTIMIDGKSQAQAAGPFAWQTRATARLRRWISNETLAFADAEHDGYRGLPDPVSHRRRVIFVKPRYWILVDDLTGKGTHRIDLRFQFAPMQARIDSAGWVRATKDGRQGLLLRTFTAKTLEGDVREGESTSPEGLISPAYGQLRAAPVAVFTTITPLPLRMVTLLWPSELVGEETPCVEIIQSRDGDPAALVFPELGEMVRFEGDEPVCEQVGLIPSQSFKGEVYVGIPGR